MIVKRSMLTTADNPFDPFDDFSSWYQWDVEHGYDSSGYLARILVTSDELSDGDLEDVQEIAIDEIISENLFGVYKKVTREFEIE
jgi:hypothetical protein